MRKMIQKMKIRKALFINKLTLFLLKKALSMYRKQSRMLISNLSAEALWVSGIEYEEQHLDNTERIILRRLNASKKK